MAVVDGTDTGIVEIPQWMEQEKNRFYYRKVNLRGVQRPDFRPCG